MTSQTPSEFGEWLIDARGRAGMTQQGLADQSGVHVNAIKKLETGVTKRPSAQTAAKLKVALGQEVTPATARTKYDPSTQAFLDMVGAYLMAFEPEARLERIFEVTHYLITRPERKA